MRDLILANAIQEVEQYLRGRVIDEGFVRNDFMMVQQVSESADQLGIEIVFAPGDLVREDDPKLQESAAELVQTMLEARPHLRHFPIRYWFYK